ncbi:ABC transporter substrate-binding protein [Ammoniphilus oxalaticus]|uniref:ABC transporter substrate-binding protein n=1 Tax=Ammoniphilus oxalaticus TaxID=66863 RepID=A0A419SMB9_9BACL|nr:ABC transporter substrate-binding protein [Ammoniphilus oxalaticus]RKD25132.1 ABC transporter substrate-binding protein [Ammoniphilus oxalaticus]
MKRLLKVLSVSLALVVVAACGSESATTGGNEEGNKSVKMFLDWTPNTNHTGIYVAREKGFYEEAGVDVEILLPGEVSANQLVGSNQGEFGISSQGAVTEARANGLPIVSVAAVIANSTSGYTSPVDRGIRTPKDFVGKKFGTGGGSIAEPMIKMVMKRAGADSDQLEFVRLGTTDLLTAMEHHVDFIHIYYAWQGIAAELRGLEMNFVNPVDYAEELNSYSPVIITNETVIANEPEKAQAFIEATAKGYEFAIEHPEEAAEILIAAEPDLDPELVKASQAWLSPRYQDDSEQWGIQEEIRWKSYADFLFNEGIIDQEIDAAKAFTNQFIENVKR